jgi:hypothetical protein
VNGCIKESPDGRSNAHWELLPLSGSDSGYYDRKHGRYIVAGDTYDGKVYHQYIYKAKIWISCM